MRWRIGGGWKLRVWFDTEFIDTGLAIHLISLGLVREDGVTYYAEVDDCPRDLAGPWVRENVYSHLTGKLLPRRQIARDVAEFCGTGAELWAWYGAYDFLCLAQLYGRMIDIPETMPQFFNDLAPIWHRRRVPFPPRGKQHHALADAQWTRLLHEALDTAPKNLG